MPHPPICVPEVGGERGAACLGTTRACELLARRLVEARPDRLVLVSPHAPRDREAFGVWAGPELSGSLADFGAPQAVFQLEADRRLAEELESEPPVRTWSIPPGPLDHGATVPLLFLVRAGWSGPTCVLSLPSSLDLGDMSAFGRDLGRVLSRLPGRTALIASGDMSHRVLPEAPGGFHPRALEFDQRVRDAIAAGRLAELVDFDEELRSLAAEDVLASTVLAMSAPGGEERPGDVLSYEHPFGVGYLVAQFVAPSRSRSYPPLARPPLAR